MQAINPHNGHPTRTALIGERPALIPPASHRGWFAWDDVRQFITSFCTFFTIAIIFFN